MDTNQELTDKVINIIRDKLGMYATEAVALTADIVDDLGADSLDEIEIIMALEDEFNIEIDDNEISGMCKTVQSICDRVGELKAAQGK